jgi:hypothetical protein
MTVRWQVVQVAPKATSMAAFQRWATWKILTWISALAGGASSVFWRTKSNHHARFSALSNLEKTYLMAVGAESTFWRTECNHHGRFSALSNFDPTLLMSLALGDHLPSMLVPIAPKAITRPAFSARSNQEKILTWISALAGGADITFILEHRKQSPCPLLSAEQLGSDASYSSRRQVASGAHWLTILTLIGAIVGGAWSAFGLTEATTIFSSPFWSPGKYLPESVCVGSWCRKHILAHQKQPTCLRFSSDQSWKILTWITALAVGADSILAHRK